MKKISLLILVIFLGISLSACEAIVNKFAFHPDKINVIPASKLPSGIEELAIETEDNITITSLYLPVKGADKVVIYFHGNGGNIYHRLPSLMQLKNFGFNVVGAGYRGYAKNEGEPSEQGIYRDGKAVLDHVTEKLGFPHKNIIVLGRSIGTTVAINTSQNAQVGGLILVTPLTSGRAHANTGSLSFVSWLAGDSFNNISKIKNVSAPVLVIHGTQDQVIPFSMGEEIFNAVSSKKTLVSIDGGRHNDLHHVHAQQYWTSILDFLKTI